MKWEEKYTREQQPDFSDVDTYIGTEEWMKLFHELTEEIGAKSKLEYSGCSIPGWNVKFKKRGKSVCTVYPQENKFQVLVIANKEHQTEIEAVIAKSDKSIQKAYEHYDFMNGGKWLIYDVDSPLLLEQTLQLIQFRLIK